MKLAELLHELSVLRVGADATVEVSSSVDMIPPWRTAGSLLVHTALPATRQYTWASLPAEAYIAGAGRIALLAAALVVVEHGQCGGQGRG